jgi:elongation factor 1-beta
MGKVLNLVRVLPESVDTDLKRLEKEIEKSLPNDMTLHKVEEEPIAFGLKALKVYVITEDRGGVLKRLEESLSRLKGVSRVQVELSSKI